MASEDEEQQRLVAEHAIRLREAQAVAPDTDSAMTDGHGNWFGVRGPCQIPTTCIWGPDGEPAPEAF